MGEQDSTLAERMATAARELQDQQDPDSTMGSAVSLVLRNVPEADGVGLSLVRRRSKIETPAYTHDFVLTCDRLQNELDEGPCHDAILEGAVVFSKDLSRDERWPTWAPRVAEVAGIRSMLCFRLFTQADTVGGLNIYSRDPRGFGDEAREEGLALAAHISVAVAGALAIGHLQTAVDSRTILGQAVGIVMERYGLDADRAFAVLSRLSQHANRKLSELAKELVTTGKLPSAD